MFRVRFSAFLLALVVFLNCTSAAVSQGPEALLNRAVEASNRGRSSESVELATGALAGNPELAYAYYLRGREHFRLGKITESVADLEQYVRLRPDMEPRQWELGLSYYYAGQFQQGARQFELYQTYHDNDVENSVWRYLCIARTEGTEKARSTLMPIRNDPRIPMMAVYDMFRGEGSPQQVLETARADNPGSAQLEGRLFYAHLYIGLFLLGQGDQEGGKTHILAAEKKRIGHYMWDLARYQARLLKVPHPASKTR
jgi:lipoprotein NlpI